MKENRILYGCSPEEKNRSANVRRWRGKVGSWYFEKNHPSGKKRGKARQVEKAEQVKRKKKRERKGNAARAHSEYAHIGSRSIHCWC